MNSFVVHPSVPSGLCAALFKGTRAFPEGVYNALGRALDGGPYSHMELVTSGNGSTSRVSLSSSFIDGGVRGKLVGYSSVGNWDFIQIPDPDGSIEDRVWHLFNQRNGRPYDWVANIRFFCGFVRENPKRDFCSEFAMAALGYPEAWRYGPSGAATALSHDFKSPIIEISR